MQPLGTATVSCLNSARCGGTVEVTLSQHPVIGFTGSPVGQVVRGQCGVQTCTCTYDDQEKHYLTDHARAQLEL